MRGGPLPWPRRRCVFGARGSAGRVGCDRGQASRGGQPRGAGWEIGGSGSEAHAVTSRPADGCRTEIVLTFSDVAGRSGARSLTNSGVV
ncbi:protein of unknown function [Rhodovastum atsumiense]|nr:protein of unknown function [Rhodovastum atsumiense]